MDGYPFPIESWHILENNGELRFLGIRGCFNSTALASLVKAGHFKNLTTLRFTLEFDDWLFSNLKTISDIASLERLAVTYRATNVEGPFRPDHDAARGYLASLQRLRFLAFAGDVYPGPGCDHHMYYQAFDPLTGRQDDIGMFSPPHFNLRERERILSEWDSGRRHSEKMGREVHKYSLVLPRLHFVHIGRLNFSRIRSTTGSRWWRESLACSRRTRWAHFFEEPI